MRQQAKRTLLFYLSRGAPLDSSVVSPVVENHSAALPLGNLPALSKALSFECAQRLLHALPGRLAGWKIGETEILFVLFWLQTRGRELLQLRETRTSLL